MKRKKKDRNFHANVFSYSETERNPETKETILDEQNIEFKFLAQLP